MNTWDGLPPMCTACGEPKRRLKIKPDGIYTAACGPCEIDMTTTTPETTMAQRPSYDFTVVVNKAQSSKEEREKEAAMFKLLSEALIVVDAESMKIAYEGLKSAKQKARQWEEERRDATEPVRLFLEWLRSLWRPSNAALKEADERLRSKVNSFEARRAAELAAQLTQAQSQAELQRSVEALAVTPEKMHFREDWSVRVVDRMKVPFEFWKVDEEALHAKVRAEKGAFAVPGCEAVCEKKAVVR